ncbi:MAG: 3-dehydroquinate synthase [Acidobacteria bacterium]|nr:3-dehydroquinate synthase [Acidobacteriota bacterium]
MSRSLIVKFPQPGISYKISVGRGLLSSVGDTIVSVSPNLPRKAALVSNRRVFGLYGKIVTASLKAVGIDVFPVLIPDGEKAKSFRVLQTVLNSFSENKMSRTDAVVALGGGVVGDLAGVAASLHLRGVPYYQVPTTLLAMIDSSVGGKTGINSPYGKNLIGSFYQPKAVIADTTTLMTLPKREIVAGFMEAVKQAALSGLPMVERTAKISEHYRKFGREMFGENAIRDRTTDLILENIRFKTSIVRSDERESVAETGSQSRKILNFGHTYGHALEKATQYRNLKHGEAVGWGLLFAATLSKKLEFLSSDELNLLNDVVRGFGRLPDISNIPTNSILDSVLYDKKVIDGEIQWILLNGIGKPVIVSGRHVPRKILVQTHKQITTSP